MNMSILNLNNEMVISFILSGLCGLAIRIVLSFSNQKWVNTYHYTLAFILLPVITLTITKIIANNIALALGMVGALSIVRFRNPVKNPFELVLYFLLITIGICMSVRSIYGIGLTLFAIGVIYSTFLIDKYFKNFFSLSFTEGKSQHILEITSNKKIPELEESNFLIQKIYNKHNENNYEIFYRISHSDRKELDLLKKKDFIENNKSITNITINYFY